MIYKIYSKAIVLFMVFVSLLNDTREKVQERCKKILSRFSIVFMVAFTQLAEANGIIWPERINKVDIHAKATGWLETHEEAGGHTIKRHVNKSDEFLRARIDKGRINEATSFLTLSLAEQIIAVGLWQHIDELEDWMKDKQAADRIVIQGEDPALVGKGIVRGSNLVSDRYGARIVLQKTKDQASAFILTAYPNQKRK